MKNYKVVWLNGESEIIEGLNIINALREAGYHNSIVHNIKYYGEL